MKTETNLHTEKYSASKYFIYTTGDYPVRVGHIIGARKVYLVEAGRADLGYFKSLKSALEAIAKHRKG